MHGQNSLVCVYVRVKRKIHWTDLHQTFHVVWLWARLCRDRKSFRCQTVFPAKRTSGMREEPPQDVSLVQKATRASPSQGHLAAATFDYAYTEVACYPFYSSRATCTNDGGLLMLGMR